MRAASATPSVEQVAESLSEPLLRYLVRYTGEPAVAEDLLQETLLRITRALPNFEARSSLKTWAFRIATNVAADHFRKPANRAHIVEVDESTALSDDSQPVDDQLVVDEMNACVRQVIDGLPADYRAALVLHELEGHTAAEVAEICGSSLATAKIRIHRGRQRLRAALQNECDFYRDADNVLRCDRKR